MEFNAYLGTAGLTDVGFRFYAADGTPTSTRTETGVRDDGDGWYAVQTTLPANTTSIRWDSTGTAEAKAREVRLNERAILEALSAAGIRAALGLAAADLDTQLAALPTALENADALLNRDMAAVTDSNARTPLNALRFLRNKWSVTGSTLTVTKEDDATAAWTAPVTTSAGAAPITGIDPA